MKYLADENVAARIVAWMRDRGDDVRYAAEERPGEIDSQWLLEAEAEARLVVTAQIQDGDSNSSSARAVPIVPRRMWSTCTSSPAIVNSIACDREQRAIDAPRFPEK
jgi:hypothetical protein